MKKEASRLCAVVLLALLAGADGLVAQERSPGVPGGSTAAIMPLQSARPAPGGGWPGGAASMEKTIEAFNAELNFALGELRGSAGWSSPEDAVERASRNPMIKVDPRRLAYRAILQPTERPLSDPLHSQLRSLSALLNTETVAVPLRISYRPLGADSTSAERKGAANEMIRGADTSDAEGASTAEAEGRAVLLLAIVNTRRGRVLWHGEIQGPPGARDSSALLATLAARVIGMLSPS